MRSIADQQETNNSLFLLSFWAKIKANVEMLEDRLRLKLYLRRQKLTYKILFLTPSQICCYSRLTHK